MADSANSSSLPASNGKTILITGITGYIASTIGMLALSKGYSIRVTSRSESNVAALREGPYKPYVSRVSIVEVPDITVPGAFDSAVKGTPLHLSLSSPIIGYCNLTLLPY
jgi:nucleoside-diphosphate-sugar epimerase